jgi:hypothetical protein
MPTRHDRLQHLVRTLISRIAAAARQIGNMAPGIKRSTSANPIARNMLERHKSPAYKAGAGAPKAPESSRPEGGSKGLR